CALATSNCQFLIEDGAGRARGRNARRTKYPHALGALAKVDLAPGTVVGRQAADVVVDFGAWARPVDARFGFIDLAGIGDAVSRLWREGEDAAGERRQRPRHQVGPKGRQPLGTFAHG